MSRPVANMINTAPMLILWELLIARMSDMVGAVAQSGTLTLKQANAQHRLMQTIHRLLRAIIMAEHMNIAKVRRAAVLASAALRAAAFSAIGFTAILRWEAAWLGRYAPIKRRDYPAARHAAKPKPTPAPAVEYALMPLPERDYDYSPAQRTAGGAPADSTARSWVKPLPPAYVYPHEICARTPIWEQRAAMQRPYASPVNAPKPEGKSPFVPRKPNARDGP